MTVTASQLLLKAADIIKEKGLYKGSFFGPEGKCCAMGAVFRADLDLHAAGTVSSTAWVALEMQVARDHQARDLFRWNDDPDRTADDVITLLRRTAEAVA